MGADGSAVTGGAVADDVQWIRERERVNGGPFWSRADAAPVRAAGNGRILTMASALGLAGAALRLTDPASGYLAGVILPVDGGWPAD